MRIDVVTVFPEMIRDALGHSIVKRVLERGLATVNAVNLRDYTTDRHKTTDDLPYGGGGGMVMKVEPIDLCLQALLHETAAEEGSGSGDGRQATDRDVPSPRIVLTDPRGVRFNQEIARAWARERHIVILCGHYEGVDERVRRNLVTDEVSIGDFILTGGELPALVIIDALLRLQPNALGDAEAPDKDTFSDGLLEYPHYTRPGEYRGWRVPDILLSGHHAEITRWRRWHQLHATAVRRPDLLDVSGLSPADRKLFEGPEPTAPTDERAARHKHEENEKHEDTDGTGI